MKHKFGLVDVLLICCILAAPQLLIRTIVLAVREVRQGTQEASKMDELEARSVELDGIMEGINQRRAAAGNPQLQGE